MLPRWTDLRQGNTNIDFIGSQSNGENNPDNQHEGFGGYTINRILGAMEYDNTILQHPNIVLLHAGTNDNLLKPPVDPVAEAPQRLSKLIEYILCNDPDTVLLVALIIGDAFYQSDVDNFNAQVPGVVAQYYAAGYKIRAVDMRSITGSDLIDGIHPTDAGYVKMAGLWFNALQNLPAGWITAPDPPQAGVTTGHYSETCARSGLFWWAAINDDKIALGVSVPGDTGATASGSSSADITFTPYWSDKGQVAAGIARDGNWVKWADLDGDGVFRASKVQCLWHH